jgi:GR25 family glycosyltransferase involved in LPS biosynthesis
MNKKRNLILFLIIILIICLKTKSVEHFTGEDVMAKIDVVYYINLDHREDRKEAFLNQMREYGFSDDKIVRIPAVYEKARGDLGCSKSHIKTMETFMQSPHTNCIVFEDDFEFTQSVEEVEEAFHFLFSNEVDYDICMLSGNEVITDETDFTLLRRAINVQTTSGFMVHKKFANRLCDNFREGARLLEEGYERGKPEPYTYAVDQYWKKLQPDSKWYIFYPKLGKQRSSVSDIQGGYIEMTV